LTDADRERAAEISGLPEAAVYGVSTFYDDLLAPRGERHVRVCTGTACFAAAGDAPVEQVSAGLGIAPGERTEDRSVSLAETVCLGFCHSSPAVRVGDVVDAGPGALDRAVAGTTSAASEPEWGSVLPEPVLTRRRDPDDWAGLRRALDTLGREALLAEVEAAEVRGRGGAGFPAGAKWRFAAKAAGAEKFIVANGDEGDPGSYIDKYLMERSPGLLLEGMALAGYAVGAAHGFVLCRSEYPLSKPALELEAARARQAGLLGDGILGTDFDFDVTIIEGAGSYVVGEAAVPGRARRLRDADRGQQRGDALQRPLRRRPWRRRLRRAQPRHRDQRLEARLLQRALRPAERLRGPLRDDGAGALRGRRRRPP
jgi:hypothetical protein